MKTLPAAQWFATVLIGVITKSIEKKANRIGKINQTALDERLEQLQLDLEQEKRVDDIAKKFVTHLNGADISGAQEVLASTNLNDMKKIQQNKYYKENVNLDSPEGKAVDNIINAVSPIRSQIKIMTDFQIETVRRNLAIIFFKSLGLS